MKSHIIQLIIASVLFATACTLYGLWYGHITDMSAQVVAIQNDIDSKTAAAGRLASARTALSEITQDEAQVESYFVSQNSVVSFIDWMENLGKSLTSTVNVLSVSTGGTPTQPILIFSLSIKGTFDAVARTVGALEYAPYNISISKLAFGAEDKQQWHADLTLLVGSVASAAATTTKP